MGHVLHGMQAFSPQFFEIDYIFSEFLYDAGGI